MRVPIPLVLFLCLAVIGSVWWYGTRSVDFLTPPSAAKLADAKVRIQASLPPEPPPAAAVAAPVARQAPAPPPPPPPAPKPTIELGDLSRPVTLQEYANFAPLGAGYLADLAVLLEERGALARAVLAWERVLDMGKPDADQSRTAIAAIQRLRPALPAWNKDASKAIAITLHAGTSKKCAKALAPLLDETARELQRASAGILKVTAAVTAGRSNRTTTDPTPVALWLTGPGRNSVSTEVLSFTAASPKSLREDLLKTGFLLIRSYLGHHTALTPPAPLAEGEKPLDALASHITRLRWQELGTLLKRTPPKDE